MRILAIEAKEEGGVVTLTLADDVVVTCVVAVKDVGLFAASPGAFFALQPKEPLRWEQLRTRGGVVVTTPNHSEVKPLRCAVRKGDPEATAAPISEDAGFDPLNAIRELAAQIPRKRTFR